MLGERVRDLASLGSCVGEPVDLRDRSELEIVEADASMDLSFEVRIDVIDDCDLAERIVVLAPDCEGSGAIDTLRDERAVVEGIAEGQG